MTSKIINLVKTPENKAITYGQLLEEHLNLLTEEEKNLKVSEMILVGKSEDGVFYTVVNDITLTGVVALLEIAKNYFILDTVLGE